MNKLRTSIRHQMIKIIIVFTMKQQEKVYCALVFYLWIVKLAHLNGIGIVWNYLMCSTSKNP